MKKKIMLTFIISSVVIVLSMLIVGIVVDQNSNENIYKKNTIEMTKVFVLDFEVDGILDLPSDTEFRATIVDKTGTVLFDSTKNLDITKLDNHIDRPEIVSAKNGEPKPNIRHSKTTGEDMVYYAEVANFGGENYFIRVSYELDVINGYVLGTMPYILILGILLVIVGVFIAIYISSTTVGWFEEIKAGLSRVNSGEFEDIATKHNKSELAVVISEINEISHTLSKTILSLKQEQTKLDFVLNNITDGVVAVDDEYKISVLNSEAKNIFNKTDECLKRPIEFLTQEEVFLKNIQSSSNRMFELKLFGKIYFCTMTKLNQSKDFSMVIVLRDITERKNAEKMRSEFFQNASHELKTPLTAIKGFGEILTMTTTDDKTKKILEKVNVESERMLFLIKDMLELSSLENNAPKNVEKINIRKVCMEVFETMSLFASEKNITMSVVGEGEMLFNNKHIYELIKNLVENSVKYSKENGVVEVKITESINRISLRFKDNGIGIEQKHQHRIFERFYRVDKSRSRQTGGTGLGLSIVKHIVESYNGTITLKSKQSIGTEITVTFPK